jgi:hypothetical protein
MIALFHFRGLLLVWGMTISIEQVPKEHEVAHAATLNLDAGKTL